MAAKKRARIFLSYLIYEVKTVFVISKGEEGRPLYCGMTFTAELAYTFTTLSRKYQTFRKFENAVTFCKQHLNWTDLVLGTP
jgi:hypothetical protein